jgi:hypothetical protein
MAGYLKVGNWVNDRLEGPGELFWLESSKAWKENYYAHSTLLLPMADGRLHPAPFNYKGNFHSGAFHDEQATVTIRDGTTRVGPWHNNKPVGNWDDHLLVAGPSLAENAKARTGGMPLSSSSKENYLVEIGEVKKDATVTAEKDEFHEYTNASARVAESSNTAGSKRQCTTADSRKVVHKHDSLSHEKQQKHTHSTMAGKYNNTHIITKRLSPEATNTSIEQSLSLLYNRHEASAVKACFYNVLAILGSSGGDSWSLTQFF